MFHPNRNSFSKLLFNGFQQNWRLPSFCLLLKWSIHPWKNSLFDFFMHAMQKFKWYINLFVLESIHNLCKVHDYSFLFINWFVQVSFFKILILNINLSNEAIEKNLTKQFVIEYLIFDTFILRRIKYRREWFLSMIYSSSTTRFLNKSCFNNQVHYFYWHSLHLSVSSNFFTDEWMPEMHLICFIAFLNLKHISIILMYNTV